MDEEEFKIAYGNNKTLSVDELPFNYDTQIITQIENKLKS